MTRATYHAELEVRSPSVLAEPPADHPGRHVVPPIGIAGLGRLAAKTDDTCVRDVFLAEVPLRPFTIRHTERLEIRFDRGAGGLTRLGVDELVTMADEHWIRRLA